MNETPTAPKPYYTAPRPRLAEDQERRAEQARAIAVTRELITHARDYGCRIRRLDEMGA